MVRAHDSYNCDILLQLCRPRNTLAGRTCSVFLDAAAFLTLHQTLMGVLEGRAAVTGISRDCCLDILASLCVFCG